MKNANEINILVACEESQAVCIEFRKLGFNAFSCDILECSGGHPEWHLHGSVMDYLHGYYECKCGMIHEETAGKYGCCGVSKLHKWDAMIAFPPCTHLAVSGAAHFKKKIADGRQQEGIDFFMQMINAPIERIAVENPIGIMSSRYKKPTQIIEPYYFGDEAKKPTCLWLKNLPALYHNSERNLFDNTTTHSVKGEFVELLYASGKTKKTSKWEYECACSPIEIRAKLRSKTFHGIAKAMATQWGEFLLSENNRQASFQQRRLSIYSDSSKSR